ncbi:MAG: VOC family protein [Pyrinomonadaceae bacterium]
MARHEIVKITLRSADFDRTRRFYTSLFEWRFTEHTATYMSFDPPSGIGGGFQRIDTFSQGDSYLLYISVDEFEPYINWIAELEGTIGGEIETVTGVAEYLRIYDPDGNRLALYRSTETWAIDP